MIFTTQECFAPAQDVAKYLTCKQRYECAPSLFRCHVTLILRRALISLGLTIQVFGRSIFHECQLCDLLLLLCCSAILSLLWSFAVHVILTSPTEWSGRRKTELLAQVVSELARQCIRRGRSYTTEGVTASGGLLLLAASKFQAPSLKLCRSFSAVGTTPAGSLALRGTHHHPSGLLASHSQAPTLRLL